jgi:hypothetical protein
MAFGSSARWNTLSHLWLVAGVIWVLVGIDREVHLSLPWFMAGWLTLRGVLHPEFVLWFVAIAAVCGIACAAAAGRRLLTPTAVALTLAIGVTLAIGAERWCGDGARCGYLKIDDPHIRVSYLYGERWLGDHVRDANIAYAGINLPYPLSGSHLTNTVYYVNIDEHLSWRFDQYARSYERGELTAPASPLARPSGVLMPASGADAVRPRYERRAGDPDKWKMSLERERIAYLFVDRLDAYEVDYQWHDAAGFPIENEWARTDPQSFRLTYANDDVRIYAVSLAMTDRAR